MDEEEGPYSSDDADDSDSETDNPPEGFLGWERELDIIYKGTSEGRVEFIRGHNGSTVSPFGLRAIIEMLLCGERHDQEPPSLEEVEAVVEFLERLVENHRRTFRSMVQSFQNFPLHFIHSLTNVLALFLPLTLLFRLVRLLSHLPKLQHPWATTKIPSENAWALIELPWRRPSPDSPASGTPTARERKGAMGDILMFVLRLVKLNLVEVKGGDLQTSLTSLVASLVDEEDEFTEPLIRKVFEDPICDLGATPRSLVCGILATLALRHPIKLDSQLVFLISHHLDSDLVWYLLADFSVESIEWLHPLLIQPDDTQPRDRRWSSPRRGTLGVEDAALDLLAHGLADKTAVSRDPSLRGTMLNALWFCSNLCVEDAYKCLFREERFLRVFIDCWTIPAFVQTVTMLFKNLLTPDDTTVQTLLRLGWAEAYQASGEVLDILEL
jgi:hypothetical protein